MKLKPKTPRANEIIELHGGTSSGWEIVAGPKDVAPHKDRPGPWYLIQNRRCSILFWFHEVEDEHFEVSEPNTKDFIEIIL